MYKEFLTAIGFPFGTYPSRHVKAGRQINFELILVRENGLYLLYLLRKLDH